PVLRDEGEEDPILELTDIDKHWASDQIIEAVNRNLITGYEDKTFRPNTPITRAQFVTIIDRAFDLDVDYEMPYFEDSEAIGDWAEEAVAKAQLLGIVTGYHDGTFRPNKEITRSEIAVM